MTDELIGGRYRVRSALGRGGMGTVWSCLDETLRREVAVKEVGLLPGASITDAARAYREARSSAALGHPNVVTVYDMVEESGRLWMVMEQVPGRSLSELIAEEGPLDPGAVARIGAQVAEGLAAAHAAGTVHRDVKPANILVRADGVAKISDFGIARVQGDATLTGSGQLTGTPTYFSPEVARGAPPGPAADVWGLGASLYAAVEGHPAYSSQAHPVAVLHEIASTDPPTPQRAGFLTEPLARMMDRDPASRWSMADAAHVLGRLAREHQPHRTLPATARLQAAPGPEPAPRSPRPAPSSPRPARRRRGAPLLALAIAALLLGGGAVWLLSRGAGDVSADTQHSNSSTAGSSSRQGGASGSSSSPENSTGSSPENSPENSSGSSSSATRMEQLVRDYYARAPGGTDAAWRMLGPNEKAQGRDSYDSFWQGIERVDVQQVTADPASHTVDVTLVYHRTDGSTSTELKREGLVQRGGRYLIDSDEPRS